MLVGDLREAGATQATHGMCEGADAQFHDQVKGIGYFVIGCPGVTAFGGRKLRADCTCDLVMPEKGFLARNRDIVRESDVVIATPKETIEQARGSGVWATIRYAREAKKPLVIVWPDGTSVVEHVLGVQTTEQYRATMAEGRMGVVPDAR